MSNIPNLVDWDTARQRYSNLIAELMLEHCTSPDNQNTVDPARLTQFADAMANQLGMMIHILQHAAGDSENSLMTAAIKTVEYSVKHCQTKLSSEGLLVQ